MKICFPIIIIILSSKNLYSQADKIFFDTTVKADPLSNFAYYSKTDFTKIDTVNLWNYELDTSYKGRTSDTLKSLGQIRFWRTVPIDDKISHGIYGRYWTPHILFEVYFLKDSASCYQQSNRTRFLSSCVPPDVGGDIIKFGSLVFISRGVCLSCQRHDTKVDYCRPLINYIFSQIDPRNATSLTALVEQLNIREGKFSIK
jgi:hypothetical protein